MGTECRSTSYLSLKVSNGVQTYCCSTENPGNCLKRRGGRSTHGIVDTAPSDANCNFGNMPGQRKLDTPYSRCVWRGWGGWLRLVRGVIFLSVSDGRSVQTIVQTTQQSTPQKTTIRHGQRHLVALRRRTVDHTVGLLAGESLDSEDDRRSAIARFYKKRARAELAPAEDTPHAKPG